MLWKGSERRIGKVRLVKESRFGTMVVMIFIFSSLLVCFGCAVVACGCFLRGVTTDEKDEDIQHYHIVPMT